MGRGLRQRRRFAPALKQRLSPTAPFGIGLRLSARDARELLQDTRLDEFRRFLDQHGLYVALINGFPHGSFHRTPVKAEVYAPDWRDEERVRYTLDLVAILERLLPEGLDGGISTAPLSYKPWVADVDTRPFIRNVVRVAEALVRVRQRAGDEAAPGHRAGAGLCASRPATSSWSSSARCCPTARHCWPARSAAMPRPRAPTSSSTSRCASTAVILPSSTKIRARRSIALGAAGVKVGRVQLSSAIKVAFPRDETACAGWSSGCGASPTQPTCTR